MKDNWSADMSDTPDESETELETESGTETEPQTGIDNDIVSLLKKMQHKIAHLEKKIDLLISQSKERQPGRKPGPDKYRNKSFSKPFRSFDQPQQRGRSDYSRGRREGDSAQGHFYEHRPQKKGRSAGPGKKPFSYKRKDED
jgi:hypothetical protein